MILIVLYLNYYVYFDKHLVKYYEIKPVQPKGNLSWMFIGRTDAEAEIQYIGHLMWRADSFEKAEILGKKHQKKPWCWERLKEGGEGDGRGWNGWIASLTQWTWVWVKSRSCWWTRRPGVLQFMGSQRVRHDWVTELDLEWENEEEVMKCSILYLYFTSGFTLSF